MVLRETQEGLLLKCKIKGCGAYINFRKENDFYYITQL